MIQENFLHIDKKETFDSLKEEIKDDSLTFINETGTLYHHGKEFLLPTWTEIGDPLRKATNGYDYVDMGEAGIWAKYPLGITEYNENCIDNILYFAWGETTGYTASQVPSEKRFEWSDYKHGSGSSNLFKYNNQSSRGPIDNLTILEPEDDAVASIMGGNWRIPTLTEFTNLLNACNTEWVTNYNGVSKLNGRLFKLKSDSSKELFFPAAGNCNSGSVNNVGSYGYYWSSSLYTIAVYYAYRLLCYSGNASTEGTDRYYGRCLMGFLGSGEQS